MPRLRRVDPTSPGLTRRRRGRGFVLLDEHGEEVDDPEVLARVNALVLPPAWKDVWICPHPNGHIQAIGTDAAGRKQYRYHDHWHVQQSRRKFDAMERFARALPDLRAQLEADLARDGLDLERVLAVVVRLLDRGLFRIGTEDYAEVNGTYGLATMRKEHVTVVDGEALVFDFPAKHGRQVEKAVVDPGIADVVAQLKRRRGGGDELFAYRASPRAPWQDVRSEHINRYLKERTGLEVSAKDFRTWGATVLAAVTLAVAEPPRSKTARKRIHKLAVDQVAHHLHNTPAVARSSYIDPRVFDRFDEGETIRHAVTDLSAIADPGDPAIQGAIEAAVLELLRSEPPGSGKG